MCSFRYDYLKVHDGEKKRNQIKINRNSKECEGFFPELFARNIRFR